jgi:hypothetical protein
LCAVGFQVFGLFCITWLTPRASNFGLIPEKSSDSVPHMKITIPVAYKTKLSIKYSISPIPEARTRVLLKIGQVASHQKQLLILQQSAKSLPENLI